MSSMKKVISLIISLTMIVSLITITGVSAADGDIIYEDFGNGFTIGEGSITTTSGLTVTAHANVLVNDNFAASDAGLYVPGKTDGLADSGDLKGANFAFDPITEGTAEISFDLTIVNPGYSHNSSLGLLYGVDANAAEMEVISHKFWTATSITSASTGETAGDALFFGDGGYDSSVKVTSATNEKVRATYVIDMTERTVDVLVNGVSIGTRNIKAAATSVSELRFYDDYNCASYIIDNLTVVRNAEATQKTITFEGADVDAITTTYGREVTLPTPEDEGEIFLGWADAQGNIVEDTFILTENMDLTASFRELLAIKEDFGSNFSIDYNAKTIKSNSGLTFSTTKETSFDESNGLKVGDNGLSVDLNGGALADSDVLIKFSSITSGKVYIAFDLINNHSSNGHTQDRLALGIGDSATSTWATTLTTVDTSQFRTEDGTVVPEGTIEYVIDLDNGTYTITAGGELVGGTHVLNATDKFDAIYVTTNDKEWYSVPFAFDNLTLIENPDTNYKTVTFMNGDAVYSTQTVAVFENAVMPEGEPSQSGKLFLGWVDSEGNAVTEEMLKGITENATYYASFRGLISAKETFDTGFSIDYVNKTMTSNSGLTFSSTKETSFDTANGLKVGDNGLRVDLNGGALADSDVLIKFPSIASGKVYIAFDLVNTHSSDGHTQDRMVLGIGDSATSTWATTLTTVNKDQFKTEDNTVVPEGTIEYVIDLDNGTYTITAGGELVGGIHTLNATANIDAIYVTTNDKEWYSVPFTFDNLTVIENPENNTKTVTFMNGSEVYSSQAVAVFGDAVMPEGKPSQSGKLFLGWVDSEGNAVTEEMLKGITEDATYYANFRDLVNITETFGENFTINYVNKTMTSNSGLTFSTTKETSFDESNGLKVGDNGLRVDLNGGALADSDVLIKFSSITSGKVYIAFDLVNTHSSDGHTQDRMVLGIGDSATSNWATTLTTVNKDQFKTEDNTVVPEGTIEYVIDLDNGTYTITAGGELVGGTHVLNATDKFDAIYVTTNDKEWYSVPFAIDNITIIEGYEEPAPEIPNTVEGEFDATGCAEKVLADGEVVTINGVLKNGIIDARLGSVVMGTTTLTGRITFNADGEVDAEVGDTVKMVTTLTEDFIYGDKNYGQGIMNGFIQKTPITAATKKYTMILTANGTDGNGNAYTNKTREVPFEIKDNTFEGNARFRAIVTSVPEGVTIEAAYGVAE